MAPASGGSRKSIEGGGGGGGGERVICGQRLPTPFSKIYILTFRGERTTGFSMTPAGFLFLSF